MELTVLDGYVFYYVAFVCRTDAHSRNIVKYVSCLLYTSQAGGGIVAKSNDEYELQEVNNKLGALKKAIEMAEKM